jgi:hypothetical protein
MKIRTLQTWRARVHITPFLEEEMRKLIARTALAMFAAILVAPDNSAPAAAVNFQFRQSGEDDSAQFTGVGAALDAGTFWNQVSFTTVDNTSMVYTLPGTIFNSDGVTASASTISSFTPSGTGTGTVGIFADGTDPAKSNALTDTYLLTLNNATPNGSITMKIGGLTAGAGYDLYFYAQNSKYYSDATNFTIGGNTQNVDNRGITEPNRIAGAYYLAPGANNYTVFSSVTADLSGNITVDVKSSDFEGVFNGFQIVSVPEPTTAAVAAMGVLGVLLPRRGHRGRNA